MAKGAVEVVLNDSALDRGMAAAKARLQAWGSGMMNTGGMIASMGLAMATPFMYAINAASDAAETLNKFDAVFGSQAQNANRFAESLGSSIGRGTTEIRNGMSALMAEFVGLGFSQEQAAKMAQEMTALSYDFGSFFNVSDADALQRFVSAFAGSSQVLDMFGINIKASAMDLEFMRMGLGVTTATADEAQKTLARFNIIKNTMQKQGAVGDALKTADSFANTWKRAKAMVTDAAEGIGTALLFPAAGVVGVIANVVGALAAWARENQMAVAGVAAGIVTITAAGVAMVALGATIYAVGFAIGLLAPLVSFAAGGFGLLTVATWAWSAVTLLAKFALWGLSGGFLGAKLAGLVYSAVMAIVALKTTLATAGVNLLASALAVLAFIAIPAAIAAILSPFIVLAYLMHTTMGAFDGLAVAGRSAANGIAGAFDDTLTNFKIMTGELGAIGTTAFGALKDAYGAGDWATIWETLKISGQAAWLEVSSFALFTFYGWKDAIVDTFESVWVELKAIFEVGWGFLKSGWYGLTSVILNAMSAPFDLIKNMIWAMSIIDPTGMAGRAYNALNSVNIDEMARQADANVGSAIVEGQRRADAIRQQGAIDQMQRDIERVVRDAELNAGREAEAGRLQRDLGNVADQARFSADWAFATDDERMQAAWSRELMLIARDAGDFDEAARHQADLDAMWQDAQFAFVDRELRAAGDAGRSAVDTAKGKVLGSFNAEAIFGMLGASESPAIRQIREMQETNKRLDAAIIELQNIAKNVVIKRS